MGPTLHFLNTITREIIARRSNYCEFAFTIARRTQEALAVARVGECQVTDKKGKYKKRKERKKKKDYTMSVNTLRGGRLRGKSKKTDFKEIGKQIRH